MSTHTRTRVRPVRPSDALRHANTLDDLCPRDRASAALDHLLRHSGYGAVESLSRGTGFARQTLKNYRSPGRAAFHPSSIWRIAAYYCADPIPQTSAELDEAIERGIPDADQLFDLFYSDKDRDVFTWLYENRSANFRWNSGTAA